MLINTTPLSHVPVLVPELLSATATLKPTHLLDCTFGRGGHSLAFLNQFKNLNVLAVDQDQESIDSMMYINSSIKKQITILKKNFHALPSYFKHQKTNKTFDIILMDLGVSSPQLDDPKRGFSFYANGPLDMRMDQSLKQNVNDIINRLSKKELNQLFQNYGEIKRPFLVVDELIRCRKKKPIQTTKQLADIILKYSKFSRWGRHPATPYFLALRMLVNNELNGLQNSLPDFLHLLNPKGRLMIISFHSLEDRIIKQALKSFVKQQEGYLWNKKVIRSSKTEREKNPRCRSAKLRVFVKK